MKLSTLIAAGGLAYSGTASEAVAASFEQEVHSSPIVGKFAGNIYNGEYFRDSVYYDYISAFWQGYNMQTYLYADQCLDNFSLFMDAFHDWWKTATYKRSSTELFDFFFLTAGTSFNDAWYYCFLYEQDFVDDYGTKLASFNDFGEIYLSLIFNLLQNSLNIKSQTENMIAAYELHSTKEFCQALGSVLRSVLDFESYTALQGSLESETPTPDQFRGQTSAPVKKTQRLPKFERQALVEEKLAAGQRRIDEARQNYQMTVSDTKNLKKTRAEHKKMKQSLRHGRKVGIASESFTWSNDDYIQIPIASLIGALHALPQDTDGPECSSNTLQFRQYLLAGFEINEDESETDATLYAAQSYHTGLAFLDEVGVLCSSSFRSTLNATYFLNLFTNPQNFLINLLYNAGFMWVDAINYIYYTEETVPDNDWAFFVSYLGGDFVIRIFYHDPTPQQPDL